MVVVMYSNVNIIVWLEKYTLNAYKYQLKGEYKGLLLPLYYFECKVNGKYSRGKYKQRRILNLKFVSYF